MIYILVTTILLIFFLIIIGLLVVPFQISLYFSKKGSLIRGDFKIHLMKIRIFHERIPLKEKKEKKKKKPFDRERILKIISLLWESYPYLTRIWNALLKSISIENLYFNFIIGLNSPVDTAIVSGYLWSLASVANITPNMRLSIKPDFKGERLDGSMKIKLKIRLFWISTSFIKAFTKKPVRSLFKEIRGG